MARTKRPLRVVKEDLLQRQRVGQLVRRRRLELDMSLEEVARAVGFKHKAAISVIERGVQGLPLKHAYRFADVLQVPREDFFRFVLGDVSALAPGRLRRRGRPDEHLSPREQELLANYRRLAPKYQDRVDENVAEFLILEGKEALSRRSRTVHRQPRALG
jgi:transcriptional regulator with XRE-family HTH domain